MWAPFLALAAALFVVLLIGGTAIALLAAADPDFESDNLPVGVTLALTAFQNVVFVFAAYITVKLALGRATRADFGLVPVRKVGEAVSWALLVYVGFWLITALLAADLRHARRAGARPGRQGRGLARRARRLRGH